MSLEHGNLKRIDTLRDQHDYNDGASEVVHHTAPVPTHRVFANPAPLGLMAFAGTSYVLSMYNLTAGDVTVPNVVLGMAIFYGGLAQLLAGMWDFANGNTFGAAAFTSYGAFWLSFSTFYIPGLEVVKAYTGTGAQLEHALGIYLSCWLIITVMFFIAVLRTNVALVTVFFLLSVTFLLLTTAKFTGSAAVTKTGGAIGIITAFAAWYVALSDLLAGDAGVFHLPVGPLSHS